MADVFLDFETRTQAEIDLTKSGSDKYSKHPLTEPMCCAFKVGNTNTKIWIPEYFKLSKPLDEINIEKDLKDRVRGRMIVGDAPEWLARPGACIMHAHNAAFERNIYDNVMAPYFRWTPPPVTQWRCTAAKARAYGLPGSLDMACEAAGLKIRKDKAGHGVMQKMCKPRKPTKNNPSVWFDDDERKVKLFAYCITDVDAEYELNRVVPDLPQREQVIWVLDQIINGRGIPFDRDMAQAGVDLEAELKEKLNERLSEITEGSITTSDQRDRILEYCTSRGVNLSSVNKEAVSKALKKGQGDKSALQVLAIRQLLSQSASKKYQSFLDHSDDDNLVRGTFMYHGAGPGRWSGRGLQPHNFKKGIESNEQAGLIARLIKERNTDVLHAVYGGLKTALALGARSIISAPDGYRLLVGDFDAVEARGLAWLTDDVLLLELFRKGLDPYIDFAHELYTIPRESVTKKQRGLGKVAILGLGYQMGAERFVATCAEWGVGEIDLDFATEVVQLYRSRHPKVKAWWYELGDCALECVGTRRTQYAKSARFEMYKNAMQITLRSGRKISYIDPKIQKIQKPWGLQDTVTYMTMDKGQWKRVETYGGKLAENVDQGTCRDFLADSMIRAERGGYKICMHVHDEVVSSMPAGEGSAEEFKDLLAGTEKWATGMPLGASVWEGFRYRKD